MSDDRSFADRNARSEHHLQELIARLAPDDYAVALVNGWTVGATLAHLAFWDRWVVRRWRDWERFGGFRAYPDDLIDLINEAALPEWMALPPDVAAELALTSAAAIDAAVAALPPVAIADALATGRAALVDRTPHRAHHLNEIETALMIGQDARAPE
jgi:hypothetical protein